MKRYRSLDEALDFISFCIRQSQEDIEMSRQETYRFTHPGVSMVALGAYKRLGISSELEDEAKKIIQEFPRVAEKHERFTQYLERVLNLEKKVYEILSVNKQKGKED